MLDSASAELVQQISQDLVWQKSMSFIYCGHARNSWLCRTYQARHSEERIFSEVTRFEGGCRRWHDQPTNSLFFIPLSFFLSWVSKSLFCF